jgi:hypothetical protein
MERSEGLSFMLQYFPNPCQGKRQEEKEEKRGKKIKILKSPPGGTPEMGFQDLFKD